MADNKIDETGKDLFAGAGPAETKEETKEQTLLRTARKRFDRAMRAENDNRVRAVEALKFRAGDQWPDPIKTERQRDKRPCLTINKIPTFVNQVVNDQRQNRPGINISPVGDKSDPHTAQMYMGLIRHIEHTCNAEIAYDTAFESAVNIGWGYWIIKTEYEFEDSNDQIIKIERVRNPFRVYLDPDRQEPDGSDAKWGFVTDMMEREEFEEKYPDADPMAWLEQGIGEDYKHWINEKQVRIALYYVVETCKRKLVHLGTGHLGFEDELADSVKEAIKNKQIEVIKERESECKKIRCYVVSAKDVLEDYDWPGKWIPIVEVVGNEIDIEGKVHKTGLIEAAKDPQRMYNYWATAETEQVALLPKAPYIGAEGQFEGHEAKWKQANIKNYPYLEYKPETVGGKILPAPMRQQFSGPPAAIVGAKQAASQDMQATTGIRFDATKHERLTTEAGIAIKELRRTGELGSFHYVDNHGRSLKHGGRILVDLIPHYYDTPRIVTIIREDDSKEQVKIDPTQSQAFAEVKHNDGKRIKSYNPKLGHYDVEVTIGPSFATKRIEAAESMMGFLKAYPQAGPLIGDLLAKYMDWPGADEIAKRLIKSLPPGIIEIEDDKLPPEVVAVLHQTRKQIQALMAERQQLIKQLSDESADRAVDVEKINKEYEAKLAKIAADVEMGLREIAAKMEMKMMELQTTLRTDAASRQAEERSALREEAATKESAKEKASPIHITDSSISPVIGEIGKSVQQLAEAIGSGHSKMSDAMTGQTEKINQVIEKLATAVGQGHTQLAGSMKDLTGKMDQTLAAQQADVEFDHQRDAGGRMSKTVRRIKRQ